MKRSKETIINRRIMHRYQQQYRLWKPIIMGMPILRIDTSIIGEWNKDEWTKYCRQGVLLVDSEKPTCHVSYCVPNRKNAKQQNNTTQK